MSRGFLLFGFFCLVSFLPALAQNEKLISKISKEICTCLNKYEELKTEQEVEVAMEKCIMKSAMKNLEVIKKELGIDMTEGEMAGRQFGEVVAFELVKKCPTFLKYIMMVTTEEFNEDTIGFYDEYSFQNPDLVPYEKFSTDTMKVMPGQCEAIRNGTFTYSTENEDKQDYFVLSNKLCTEYHDSGKYISRYHIKWKSDCEYESVFIDSTNPEINNLLTKGDKIYYQFLGIYKNTVYLNLDYKGFSKTFKMTVVKQ